MNAMQRYSEPFAKIDAELFIALALFTTQMKLQWAALTLTPSCCKIKSNATLSAPPDRATIYLPRLLKRLWWMMNFLTIDSILFIALILYLTIYILDT